MKRSHRRLVAAAVACVWGLALLGEAHVVRAQPPAGQVAPHPGGSHMPVQVGPGRVQSPPGGEHAGAVHQEEEHESGPKPVNWVDFSNKDQPPYLAAVINFAILAFVYVYFGKAPIAAALQSRRQEVSKQIDEAQKIKREAEARSKQYAAKLEDLGMELETTKAGLAAAGAGEKARIVREAEEKATRMEKDAAFLVEQERKQMQADLQREAVQAALGAAEELLRTKLTLADQERVAEEFLATLVPTKSAGQAGAT